MNRKLSIYLFLSGLLFWGMSCDTPDNNHPGAIEPPNVIRDAFYTIYPEAKSAIWTVDNNYYVIHFTLDEQKNIAWLTHLGVWAMLKTEILLAQIPTAILIAFQKGEQADWIITQTYTLQRAGMGMVYKLRATNERQETDLYYTLYGELIRQEAPTESTDQPIVIPEAVTSFMEVYYPQAELLDIQTTTSGLQLAILEDTILSFVVVSF